MSFSPHPIPEGLLRHSFVSPSRREGPPSIWDTHGISGNVFANPDASSSAQELRQWNSSSEEPLHSSTVEKSERQEQNQDLRCQSAPSAKDSVILSGGDYSKNCGGSIPQFFVFPWWMLMLSSLSIALPTTNRSARSCPENTRHKCRPRMRRAALLPSIEPEPPVMADFGQTDFGQTDFGQFFDRLWPIVVLTDFGQTDFGQF